MARQVTSEIRWGGTGVIGAIAFFHFGAQFLRWLSS